MSNMAIPILYNILNSRQDVLAERVYAPWTDMETLLRTNEIPLCSLETGHSLGDFDIIGFSLGYELSYTSVLNMLDLADIPVLREERDSSHPLVIAGGSSSLNPEPMSDFIDIFVIGEGEEIILKLLDLYRNYGNDRKKLLIELAQLPGIYVPSMYRVEYNNDGRIRSFTPEVREAATRIERQVFLKGPEPVTDPVVPYIQVIHDRGGIEVQRGCSRGCRFCQAGMIYRPIRELSHEKVIDCAGKIICNCGYNEISLVSLSTGDYHDIKGLINKLKPGFSDQHISLSLPSLRLDSSSIDLIESLPQKRRMTLTFAPEAGTERLRKAINKDIPEELIMNTFAVAFRKGWFNLKLYFMIGLPSETMEDVQGIIDLVKKIISMGKTEYKKKPGIKVNVSTFVPKAHTPFQWESQDPEEMIALKQETLRKGFKKLGISLSWTDINISKLEAVLSRGDRRLGKVIYAAWKAGSRFDTWNEHFDYSRWLTALHENNLDPEFYADRQRSFDETLPWHHIDTGVTESFLKKEKEKVFQGIITGDCRTGTCNTCGLQRWSSDCKAKILQETTSVKPEKK
jgi:radical SAM family uncharacterized protein